MAMMRRWKAFGSLPGDIRGQCHGELGPSSSIYHTPSDSLALSTSMYFSKHMTTIWTIGLAKMDEFSENFQGGEG